MKVMCPPTLKGLIVSITDFPARRTTAHVVAEYVIKLCLSEKRMRERSILSCHSLYSGSGLCAFVNVRTILPPSPVILWIELGGKPKWLPLSFGYHDVMRTAPIV